MHEANMSSGTTSKIILVFTVITSHSPCFALNGTFSTPRNSLQKQTSSPHFSDTLTIRYDPEVKTPVFISGKLPDNSTATSALSKIGVAAQKRSRCRSYLSKIGRALRIARPADELTIMDQGDNNSSETAHYKIRQKFRGIPVLGAEATLHLHGDRAEFVGRTIATPDISIVPAISEGQAVDRALDDLHANGTAFRKFSTEEQVVLEYDGPSAELVVFPSLQTGSPPRLAYQVLLRPNMLDWWEYDMDARTGEILLKFNRTCDAGDTVASAKDANGEQRSIHSYIADKNYLIDVSRPMFDAAKSQIPDRLTGAIVTYDYRNKSPTFSSFSLITRSQNTWDPKAVSAQYNATVAYEYYLNTHGRNSIDGKGGTIRSFINVADQTGIPMDNAYWNGQGMYYGNGYRVFNPLVAALDVAGHELTHGVVDATAALRYIGQSGALNESFADIFGCMIERDNWTIGESVIRAGVYPSNALRDLSDPHNGLAKGKEGWQPRTMAEYQKLPNTSAGDNGGVHINSGIPSYAFYLFASAVGKKTAERVFYLTLASYLSASSQFADLRISSRLACEELYGEESPEMTALAAAFDSVGIKDDTQPFEHVEDIAPNPGGEYVLLTAAPRAEDGTTMYIADSMFGSLNSISKRPVDFRPSVSDNGKKILFVSDKKLIALTLSGTGATETVIDSSDAWSVAAISRDGLRFAAVRDEEDTAIYIGSISDGSKRKFSLNGPPGSTAAVTGAVSSTALEWDFTGDEVVYDVFNSLPGPGRTSLTNWDIGFLRSWDHTLDTFGDGEVSKLFNNLGDGISVGNPTFSKNSPNILAYECIDELTYSITVMTMNMENRKNVTVATTEFPGYPSYSRLDDRIAFSTIDGADTVISVVKVKSDKQTADGDPVIAIRKMKWALFFADGNRVLVPTRSRQPVVTLQPAAAVFDITVRSYNGGMKAEITGAQQLPVRLSIIRADGKVVYRTVVFSGVNTLSWVWNGMTAAGAPVGRGMYFVRAATARGAVTRKLVIY